MPKSSVFGTTLQGVGCTFNWQDHSAVNPNIAQKLIIKQVLLGSEANPDEFNVVEVDTAVDQISPFNINIPIAVLKPGDQRVVYPNVEFYDSKLTFRLKCGAGPVYILGQLIKNYAEILNAKEPPLDFSSFDDDLGPKK